MSDEVKAPTLDETLNSVRNFTAADLQPLCTKCQGNIGAEAWAFVHGTVAAQFCSKRCMKIWLKRKGIEV